MIHSPPKVVPLAIHLHENLVRVPLPFGVCYQFLNTLSSDLSSKHGAKPVPPILDSFVTQVDASLVQQVFDIPKRERETDVQHHRKADDLGIGFEVFERSRSGNMQKPRNTPAPLNQVLLKRPWQSFIEIMLKPMGELNRGEQKPESVCSSTRPDSLRHIPNNLGHRDS